jgi:hypothetical protein
MYSMSWCWSLIPIMVESWPERVISESQQWICRKQSKKSIYWLQQLHKLWSLRLEGLSHNWSVGENLLRPQVYGYLAPWCIWNNLLQLLRRWQLARGRFNSDTQNQIERTKLSKTHLFSFHSCGRHCQSCWLLISRHCQCCLNCSRQWVLISAKLWYR